MFPSILITFPAFLKTFSYKSNQLSWLRSTILAKGGNSKHIETLGTKVQYRASAELQGYGKIWLSSVILNLI